MHTIALFFHLLATMSSKTTEKNMGIPIGVVQLPPQQIQPFRNLLAEVLQQPTKFRGVDKNGSTRIIHLPPLAAASLDEQHPELMGFLQAHSGEYRPGVRKRCPTLDLVNKHSTEVDDDSSVLRFVELFAGIGGFRLGLEQIGGQCVLANEVNEGAASIYRANFDDSHLALGDILDIATENLPDFDCLVGGFPCQPFTTRGDQPGFKDDRGQLYREVARILDERRPKCFILENVPGLVTLDGGSRGVTAKGSMPSFEPGAVFERVLEVFRSCGYQVDWRVLNSRKWLPQMRERVYIVGTRNDLGCPPFNWDQLLLKDLGDENPVTVRDILEPKDSPSVKASVLTEQQFAARREGKFRCVIHPDRKAPTLIARYHTVHGESTKFVFEEADGTKRQLPRFLTPRECTRLMGFPEEFIVPAHDNRAEVSKYYHAIGNAVCPIVIANIGKELKRCIRMND